MSDLGNKKIMAKNISYYMSVTGKTRKDLCQALGLSYMTVSDWINGKTYPRIDKIERMANLFGITKADLVEDHHPEHHPLPSNIITPSAYRVPILGTICAGDGIVIDQNYQGSIITDKRIDADYALFVKGDSMKGAGIYDGNLVYIKKFSDYEDGLIYAVGIRGEEEAVIRRVYRQDDSSALLVPCNEDFSPRLLGQDRFFLIGKVIGVYRKI